jgi:hypothetical protein
MNGLQECGGMLNNEIKIENTNNDYLLNVNDTLKINLQVSPSNEASYQWFIDDVEVGETRDLTYKFNEAKRYIVKFMVTRYGITNSRQTKVLVNK